MPSAIETARKHLLEGHLHQAEKICEDILATHADDAEALFFRGVIALNLGKNHEAIDFLRKSAALRPNHPHCHYNLGFALQREKRLKDAARSYETAISLKTGFFEALDNLGALYQQIGESSKAIALHQQAVSLKPDHVGAINNLGLALQETGELDAAISFYLRALAIRPDHAEILNNLGFALNEKGQIEEAIICYRTALALKPDYPKAKWNLALALLLLGNYEEGMELYENRFSGSNELGSCNHTLERLSPISRWKGENLQGKSILVWVEQGLGDSLMMLRYLPKIGGNIVLLCATEMLRLARRIPEISLATSQVDKLQLASFDYHCPIMSLPHVFHTTLDNIPAFRLCVPGELRNKWATRLCGLQEFKVGLVWAGGGLLRRDSLRSIALEKMSPLFAVPATKFFSLQKGAPSLQAANFPIRDWMEECNDLLDTAALVMNLDLVISVDTSVAHLAAILGKPVWLLNRFESEWRWLLQREDSPWYPGMKIFRQKSPRNWEDVIAEMKKELEMMTKR